MEQYRIIISLSRNNLSIYYRLGNSMLEPLPDESWPQPLAIMYSDAGTVTLGRQALRAALTGNKSAFTNYFDEIRRPRTVRFGAGEVPNAKLLLFAIENYFKQLLESVFFGSYGTLEDARATAPVLILTAPDLKHNEVTHIRNLMLNAGYGNIGIAPMHELVSDCLCRHAGRTVLLANVTGGDLHLTLRSQTGNCVSENIDNGGHDPRVAKVADDIWQDIQYSITDPNRQTEEEILQQAAKLFLASGLTETTADITLSDGQTATYWVSKPPIYAVQNDFTNHLKYRLENFLKVNNADPADVCLVRWGDAAANDYFRELLTPGFRNNIEQDDDLAVIVRRYMADFAFIPLKVAPKPVFVQREPYTPTPIPTPTATPAAPEAPKTGTGIKRPGGQAATSVRPIKRPVVKPAATAAPTSKPEPAPTSKPVAKPAAGGVSVKRPVVKKPVPQAAPTTKQAVAKPTPTATPARAETAAPAPKVAPRSHKSDAREKILNDLKTRRQQTMDDYRQRREAALKDFDRRRREGKERIQQIRESSQEQIKSLQEETRRQLQNLRNEAIGQFKSLRKQFSSNPTEPSAPQTQQTPPPPPSPPPIPKKKK